MKKLFCFFYKFKLVEFEVCIGTLSGYFQQTVGYVGVQFRKGIWITDML